MVLGKQITAHEKDELTALIFGSLREQFAKENKIEPTELELDAFVRKTEETEKQRRIKMQEDRTKLIQELKSSTLSVQEREAKESRLKRIERIVERMGDSQQKTGNSEDQIAALKRQVAQRFVKSWKINRALYQKYGGRVIFQQAGAEPIDAYRDFLKEAQRRGSFEIVDKKYEATFWRYFTNDAMHTFYSKEDGAKYINTPWWSTENAREK